MIKTAEQLGITEQQRVNLFKLAYYLTKEKKKAQFDMINWADREHTILSAQDCGTVGCAVGHGPYAGVKKKPDTGWSRYCQESFGFKWTSIVFIFLFSSEWSSVDNTAEGAGKRILYFLMYGRYLSCDHSSVELYSKMQIVEKYPHRYRLV